MIIVWFLVALVATEPFIQTAWLDRFETKDECEKNLKRAQKEGVKEPLRCMGFMQEKGVI